MRGVDVVIGLALVACLAYTHLFILKTGSRPSVASKAPVPAFSVAPETTAGPERAVRQRRVLQCLWLAAGLEWERDLVSHLLGPTGSIRRVIAPSHQALQGYVKSPEERQVPSDLSPFHCVIWSILPWSVGQVADVVKRLPNKRVLMLLGDEQARPGQTIEALNSRRLIYAPVFSQFKIVLRQHNLLGDFSITPPVFLMPLGYGMGIFDGPPVARRDLLDATKRKFLWSFAGNGNKFDRPEMLKQMEALGSRGTMSSSLSNPRAMRQMYEESVFVPIGHGWVNTDCFRIYEAAACGAIPIVNLADHAHRIYSHGYVAKWENETASLPPWIFVDSWDKAVVHAKSLLATPDKLLQLQKDVVSWWDKAWLRTVEVLYS